MGDVYAEATSTLPEAPEPSELPVPVQASDEEMGPDGDNLGTLLGDTPTIPEFQKAPQQLMLTPRVDIVSVQLMRQVLQNLTLRGSHRDVQVSWMISLL